VTGGPHDGLERAFGWVQIAGQLLVIVYSLIIAPLTDLWSLGTGILVVLGGIGLLTLIYRPEVLRPWIWTLAVIAGFVAFGLAPDQPKGIGFYETTAQIVPVLFVVLAVELGAFRPGRNLTDPDRRAAIVTAYALVLAGWDCLHALAENSVKAADFRVVVAALAASTVALVGLAVTTPARAESARPLPPATPARLRARDLAVAAILWLAARRR
jgi:hypothetical protein